MNLEKLSLLTSTLKMITREISGKKKKTSNKFHFKKSLQNRLTNPHHSTTMETCTAQVGKDRAFWGSLNSSEDWNSVAAEADSGPRRENVKPVPTKTRMDFESKTRPAPPLRSRIPVGSWEVAAESLDVGSEEEEEEEMGHLGIEKECKKVEENDMIWKLGGKFSKHWKICSENSESPSSLWFWFLHLLPHFPTKLR